MHFCERCAQRDPRLVNHIEPAGAQNGTFCLESVGFCFKSLLHCDNIDHKPTYTHALSLSLTSRPDAFIVDGVRFVYKDAACTFHPGAQCQYPSQEPHRILKLLSFVDSLSLECMLLCVNASHYAQSASNNGKKEFCI